jgi:hypothetical protein
MKKHIRLLSAGALSLVLSAPLFSRANGDDEVKKQRTINKSYTVTAEDKLDIENTFGNVAVSTWDKNEITVDIEIGTRAATEERAEAMMSRIDVKDWREGHTIGFKTQANDVNNDNKGKNKNEGNRSFYIDYVIHMPAGNHLQISNSFGKTEIPDFKGPINLTSKFGSLNAGKLDNVDVIDVEFGKAYITEVNNGKLVFKFNQESRVGQVNGNVRINSEFSHNVQFNIGDHIEEVSLFESYSGVRVVVNKNLSAEFDVHTSFGSFRNESDFSISERKEDESDYGPHFDKDYSGKAGDGKARIKIKSSFGSVRLSYTNGMDSDKVKDKNKNKDKDADDDDDNKTT